MASQDLNAVERARMELIDFVDRITGDPIDLGSVRRALEASGAVFPGLTQDHARRIQDVLEAAKDGEFGLSQNERDALAALDRVAEGGAVFPAEGDEHMKVALYLCGECNGLATNEAWQVAWWRERSRRMADPAWNDDDYGPNWGLDDRMVCPRCKFVHADDDTTYVEEREGVALSRPTDEREIGEG